MDYDSCLSWISKMQSDGRVVCDMLPFVDDKRVRGPDEDLTWQASHKLASTQSYLGIQDAARKARLCTVGFTKKKDIIQIRIPT
jgi:hypothetical protein